MQKTINDEFGNPIGKIDTNTSLNTMREECPNFFRKPHGKRETFTIYRGQIIVRNTVQFTNMPPTRRTVAYLYLVDQKDMSYISADSSINVAKAKRLIDKILDNDFYGNGHSTVPDY